MIAILANVVNIWPSNAYKKKPCLYMYPKYCLFTKRTTYLGLYIKFLDFWSSKIFFIGICKNKKNLKFEMSVCNTKKVNIIFWNFFSSTENAKINIWWTFQVITVILFWIRYNKIKSRFFTRKYFIVKRSWKIFKNSRSNFFINSDNNTMRSFVLMLEVIVQCTNSLSSALSSYLHPKLSM